MEQRGEKTGKTKAERLQDMREELLLQRRLAKEGKLSGYLKELREAAAKTDPDWDVLL